MSGKYEIIEPNKVKITFNLDAAKFEEGINEAYKRSRSKINIPGFRKGRAPRKIIELNFGRDIFYEDAINIILPEAYEAVIDELQLKTVSRPEISVDGIDVEDGVDISAEVYIKPNISVSADVYKGAKYKPTPIDVTQEEIDAELNKVVEQNVRMLNAERPVEDNDILTIDFEGFIDGEAFEGGKGSDYSLTIGSKSFIDDFEQQLIGACVGDQVDVNVTFPDDYHAENLAGKAALFKVDIKEIRVKELPEIDDDFAQDVSEFDTLDEYKNDIKQRLTTDKEEIAKRKKDDELIKYIINKTEMDIPDIMIENQIDQMIQDLSNQVRSKGLEFDIYLQYVGMDISSLRDSYRIGAENQVKGRLALEAVAQAENLEVSDEEREAEITRIANAYGMELERIKEIILKEDNEGIDMDIKVNKAIDFIAENAIAEDEDIVVEN